MTKLRILGIDPGLIATGWGVLDGVGSNLSYVACGTIKPTPSGAMSLRLECIYKQLSDIIETYAVDECAIEDVFVNKNPNSSLRLGQARGVAMVVCSIMGLEVFEYHNRIVKKAITGSGRADKQQITAMVKILLRGSAAKTEHSADALAIAITHYNMRKWSLLNKTNKGDKK